ncbi:MAG: FKBP-type peptidyl-prolyl cis-trans isomerase [Demequina sp.]|uniref:FKBP-type peptidyl-prolyl cis-trans isomerase n=1 Tax=Demequina sp. TaxID=2050685 RepID=UPI0019AB444B|nr:FKBP-type peptidyl-prolyl cis-trans isomerase [Demequina sp.]MBC7297376.1 FKBP-type peptidyl-prolyl cis-trans isomerase [Demequina sp.]
MRLSVGHWGVIEPLGVLHVKHRLALSAALAAAALSLAACAPADNADGSSSASAGATAQPTADAVAAVEPDAALEAMKWIDNGDGVAPDLEATTPINFTVSGARLISDGDGDPIESGQLLALDYVIKLGTDGSTLYSTYDNGSAEQVQLITGQVDPAIEAVLKGAHVGTDFLYAVPDRGQGANIMLVTVSGVSDVLDRAEGTAVAPVDGLPKVTLDADGAPSVTYPTTTKPEGLIAQDLIEGDGPVVKDGQSVTVHYSGWVWNGDKFDSSWDREAPSTFTLTFGGLIEGWVQGLVGKTVGSQVLLVIPPELGYGDAGSGDTIPGGATLVFVVDILAAN